MYRHTQIGWTVLAFFAGFLFYLAIILLFRAVTGGPGHLLGGLLLWAGCFLVTVVLALLFGALTVEVDDEELRVWFGTGLIRKQIPLADVASCRQVKNEWWYGWGIRYFGRGWLYNVSGLDAVELNMRDGSVLRIGTDEPEELEREIRLKLRETGQTAQPPVREGSEVA
jgi:hypothetical protein